MTSSKLTKLTNKRNRKKLYKYGEIKTINKNNLEPNQNQEQTLLKNQQGNQKSNEIRNK